MITVSRRVSSSRFRMTSDGLPHIDANSSVHKYAQRMVMMLSIVASILTLFGKDVFMCTGLDVKM
jgi:hypothetical protein